MLKAVVIVAIYLLIVACKAFLQEGRKKQGQRRRREELDRELEQELDALEEPSPAQREKRRQEIAQVFAQVLDNASPQEMEEMLSSAREEEDRALASTEPTTLSQEMPRPLSPAPTPVGESYAAPIPPPHTSPLRDATTPALLHAEEHMGPTLEAGNFPIHPSEAALHADAHIATTPAAPTPHPATKKPRHQPLSLEGLGLPRTAAGMRKAVLFSEILGRPRCLRPPRQEI